ncbi:MAG: hypothetical protein V4754_11960 [Pseudomonadota bacterium]
MSLRPLTQQDGARVEQGAALERRARVGGAWSGRAVAGALALGVLIALAVAAQAVLAWRGGTLAPGPLGARYSVFLSNGQVYYGELLETGAAYLKLGDVYYVQPYTQADGHSGNRLVSRKKSDWHGPDWQAIPTDKIVLIEAVGADSQLARLIEQDKAVPAPP